MTRLIAETVEAATVMAELLLRHARIGDDPDHPDRLNQRDLTAVAAALVALLERAADAIERENDA